MHHSSCHPRHAADSSIWPYMLFTWCAKHEQLLKCIITMQLNLLTSELRSELSVRSFWGSVAPQHPFTQVQTLNITTKLSMASW